MGGGVVVIVYTIWADRRSQLMEFTVKDTSDLASIPNISSADKTSSLASSLFKKKKKN